MRLIVPRPHSAFTLNLFIAMNTIPLLRTVMPYRWLLLFCALSPMSCQDSEPSFAPTVPMYSSAVVTSWLPLQLQLFQATALNTIVSPRRFAYTGIALYEAIVPGFSGYQSLAPQLNGMPPLPHVVPGTSYYWPASANAAMAAISRSFNPTTSAANKAAIDSLEATNMALYQRERPAEELMRSAEFGKQIAVAVFEWSKTDGSDNLTPFTLPVGPGMWVPTPPAFAPPVVPNWGSCRLLVRNSDAGAEQGAPISYSEDPKSAYAAQAREVYDLSQHLDADQRAIAVFWNGNSWYSVLSQVLAKKKPRLEVAAAAVVLLTVSMSDGAVCILKGKYQYTCVRPVTYIRTVLNHPTWLPIITTPAHPEYPGGHSVQSGAAAEALTISFGDHYAYTDTPYNKAAGSPRSYDSFAEAADEAAISRLYGGIHYRKTTEVSILQGNIIARNVAQRLKFKR